MCVLFPRLSSSAHNVPSAWNTLGPLLLLANAHSLIKTQLNDTASGRTSECTSTTSPSASSLHIQSQHLVY